jgi:hypothetical protein
VRQGNRLFLEAQNWFSKKNYKDLSDSLGGVLTRGPHKNVEVLELVNGPNEVFLDVVFGYEDGDSFKQRYFRGAGKKFRLGQLYNIRIEASRGTHQIVLDSAREYKLIHRVTKRVSFQSRRISEVKQFARGEGLEISVLRVVKAELVLN